MKQEKNIVRFAPSPTGDLQLGNVRTIIYNWLVARQSGGKFFIRIEDTDQERSKSIYEKQIFDVIKWLGIDFDDYLINKSYLRQSERLSIYQKKAQELYQLGHAYYCNCEESPCVLCKDHKYTHGALRFNIPNQQEIVLKDEIYGKKIINSNSLEPFMLLRKNGWPTYHLAVVVDDIEMKSNYIIRGSDHLTNTFKQILLYNAFNKDVPRFAHLPLIIGSDGKKLSKRNNDAKIISYINDGFASEAMFNILLRTGFGYKNLEKFTLEEAKQYFQIKKVSLSPGQVNYSKLFKQSREYLRDKQDKYLPILEQKLSRIIDKDLYAALVVRFYNLKGMQEYLNNIKNYQPSKKLHNNLIAIHNIDKWIWERETLKNHLKGLNHEEKAQLRLGLTGDKYSIELTELLLFLGKQESINRLS